MTQPEADQPIITTLIAVLVYRGSIVINLKQEATQQILPIVQQKTDDVLFKSHHGLSFIARNIEHHDVPAGFELIAIRELLVILNTEIFECISKAAQLLEWQRNHHFCSRCGTKTIAHSQDSYASICPACTYTQYPRIQACVIVAITKGKQILLARSVRHETMFSLIAGFVEAGETLEQCVEREVLEEVGLTVDNIQYIASQPWPFPSNLMIGFTANYVSGDIVPEVAEIAEANFYNKDNLPLLPPKGTIADKIIQHVLSTLD